MLNYEPCIYGFLLSCEQNGKEGIEKREWDACFPLTAGKWKGRVAGSVRNRERKKHCVIFRNPKRAKRREPTKTGREPGSKVRKSGSLDSPPSLTHTDTHIQVTARSKNPLFEIKKKPLSTATSPVLQHFLSVHAYLNSTPQKLVNCVIVKPFCPCYP